MATREINRARHFWQRIDAFTGRRKLREACDYIKALLAGRPDGDVVEVVEAIERRLGVPGKEVAR
jgi:hypothetical protein